MIPIGPKFARRLRFAGALLLLAIVGAFAIAAFVVGFPANPEGAGVGVAIEVPAQAGLLGLVLLGGLLSLRWPGLGAVVIAVGGLGLGLLASVEYRPLVALSVLAVFSLPAVLVWLGWQHRRRHHEVVLLAAVTALVLAGETVGSSTIYNHFFGPAHPASNTASIAPDLVEWVWSGDLRDDGATVAVRTASRDAGSVSLTVQETHGAGAPTVTAAVPVDAYRLARVRVAGLESNRRYDYTVNVDGRADHGRGRGTFLTAPEPGTPASFSVAVASCARTGSDGAVYDAIRETDPLLYLISGDLHYANLSGSDPSSFIDAIGRALTAPSQAALYRAVPVDYVWDDHDYGPNDADSTSPSRTAARTSYRAAVPHPALAVDSGPGDGAIYHAFTIGRIRFVVTDTRSERTATSLLGDRQERWLLDELRAADRFGAVVWVSSDPWIAPEVAGRDDWGGFGAQRRRIADVIASEGVDNLVMLAGDAHMVAIDDGRNSGFATNGGGGFPVLQAAALDRPGNIKGGPYSEGAHPGAGQFGLVHIDDDGARVQMTLEGRDWTNRVLVALTVALGEGPGPEPTST